MKNTQTRRASILTAAVLTAVAFTVASTTVASAGEREDTESVAAVAASLEGVRDLDPTLILPPVAGAGEAAIDGLLSVGSGAVEVPRVPEVGVELVGWAGEPVTVGLPFADEAQHAVGLADGAVVFTGLDSSSTVVVGESGVQMLTTIADEAAPTRYSYDLHLAPGQTMSLAGDGVHVLNSDDSIAIVISSAWAKDAKGVDIPTAFEVEGTTLTQVVSHTAADASYPVVADPIFIAPWVFRCLLGLGLNGPQITAAFASGTIWGGLGRAALACALGR